VPRDFGQVLVYVALVLPLVLLPVAAYAVAATALDTRHARLQAAVSQAAEDAVQRLDQAAFRAGDPARPDPAAAEEAARLQLAASDPAAIVDSVTVRADVLQLSAHETVAVPLAGFLPVGSVRLSASARVRLAAGFAAPA
jgi:hypothetical protein